MNATYHDTIYDRLLRTERERDVLAARVEFLEAALLEQVSVCEICGSTIDQPHSTAAHEHREVREWEKGVRRG